MEKLPQKASQKPPEIQLFRCSAKFLRKKIEKNSTLSERFTKKHTLY